MSKNVHFENFGMVMEDAFDDCPPYFVVACKDRESSEERWVLAALSMNEMELVYEYLKEHFG